MEKNMEVLEWVICRDDYNGFRALSPGDFSANWGLGVSGF